MPEVRLIDANALQDKIRYTKLRVKSSVMMAGFVEMKAAALREIENAPTIEAEPVRHGRWIRRETVLDIECKCSVCGYKDFVPKHDNYWFRRKFCPNCGADMREAIEDATDN